MGPLTLMQFLFVAGGVSMTAVAWIVLNGIFFFVAAIVILSFFGSLAFVRVDGQPLLNYLAYMLAYSLGAKRAIYKIKPNDNQFNLPGNGK